jgi:DNA-binding NarL/FixJ family response regulator
MNLPGPLQLIFLLVHLGFQDPREIGKALIAWKYGLTRDEVSLLQYIAEGLTNDKIAAASGARELKTVKSRIQRLYNKLGVKGRVQATVVAVQSGLIQAKVPPPPAEGSAG